MKFWLIPFCPSRKEELNTCNPDCSKLRAASFNTQCLYFHIVTWIPIKTSQVPAKIWSSKQKWREWMPLASHGTGMSQHPPWTSSTLSTPRESCLSSGYCSGFTGQERWLYSSRECFVFPELCLGLLACIGAANKMEAWQWAAHFWVRTLLCNHSVCSGPLGTQDR